MTSRIPVTVLSGFLGAGKTSFLNRLINSQLLPNCAVLVNEIGSISIDDSLLQQADENVITLSNGCICCSIQEDLIVTLGNLLEGGADGSVPAIEHVLIETTGIADPTMICTSIIQYPYARENFTVSAVVTLADPTSFSESVEEFSECRQQLAIADIVLASKTDLISDAELNQFKATLKDFAPTAVIADTQDVSGFVSLLSNVADYAGPHRDIAEQTISPNHHFSAHSITGGASVELSSLDSFLKVLVQENATNLLRLKGFVKIQGHDMPLLLQMVRTSISDSRFLEQWPTGVEETQLVVIGTGFSADDLARYAAILGCQLK